MKRKLTILILIGCLLGSVCGCCIVTKRQPVCRSETTTEAGECMMKIKQLHKIAPPRGELLVGEVYSYKVWWLGIDVANAELSIKEKVSINGRDAYHVVLTAETNKFCSFFYYAKSKAESYIDAKTFRPIKYISDSILKRKQVIKKMDYDFNAKLVYAEDRKGNYKLNINDDILDPLGIFYYFSLNKVKLDEPIKLNINAGKKNYTITLYVQKEKKVSVPAGKFWAFLVQPTTNSERQFDDVLNATGRMWVWFSSDERRIPIIMILKLPFATAQAVLTKIYAPAVVNGQLTSSAIPVPTAGAEAMQPPINAESLTTNTVIEEGGKKSIPQDSNLPLSAESAAPNPAANPIPQEETKPKPLSSDTQAAQTPVSEQPAEILTKPK